MVLFRAIPPEVSDQEDHMKRLIGAGVLAFLGLLPAAATAQFTDWSTPVNLGSPPNSGYLDSCVTISKNGLTLIFSSNRQSPGTADRDLYVSKRASIDAGWGEPLPLATLNTTAWESCPALSPDEYELYFTSDRPGSCGGADIWVAHRNVLTDDFGWQQPLNLGCAKDGYVNSQKDELTPALFESEGGTVVMYFSSLRPTSKSFDIYQSEMRSDRTFGPPTPVAELNTHDSDMSPTVRRDGLEMFFLSTRGNRNSMDFWTATRASTSDPWSTPVFVPSLGNPAFAQGKISLSFDGLELYFASYRSGNTDLWVARRQKY
jgi:hypothetical protein